LFFSKAASALRLPPQSKISHFVATTQDASQIFSFAPAFS